MDFYGKVQYAKPLTYHSLPTVKNPNLKTSSQIKQA